MSLPSRIALVGFMGSGKSTVGPILAARLHFRFFDSDLEVESRVQARISDIFRLHGEAFFRDLEHQAIQDLLRESDCVIASGGGAFIEPRGASALLARAFVVYLHCSFEDAFARIAAKGDRPLVEKGRAEALALYADRKDKYSQAHLTIDTARRSPEQVAADLLRSSPWRNDLPHSCAI